MILCKGVIMCCWGYQYPEIYHSVEGESILSGYTCLLHLTE